MWVFVSGFVFVFVMVIRFRRKVDIKFDAGDGGFLAARNVQVIAVELEFFQFALQFLRVHAEVKQGGDEHVTGDATEKVEIKNFHCWGKHQTFNIQLPTSARHRRGHWMFLGEFIFPPRH
jgi:hypothetical protein